MSSYKKFLAVLVVCSLSVGAVRAQVVSPPTPRGFVSRGVGDSQNINANISVLQQPQQPQPPSPALIQTLRMRIDGLMRQRRYDEAEAAAMDLLQRSPNDEHAIAYLRLIQASRNSLQAPLQKMIVPKVEFREASLPDVLKFLQEISGGLTADKKPLSFVLQLPAGVTPPSVTLSLHNVPMLDVLRYVTATTGLAFKAELHAVVIYKPQASPAAPVTPTIQ